MVIAMVETVSALDDLDAIAATDGIDVLWIGHFDLTASMGIAGQFDHPRYAAALAAVVDACERNGIAAGISTDDADARRRARPPGLPLHRRRPRHRAAARRAAAAARRGPRRPPDPSRGTDMPKQPLHSDQAGPPLGAYSQGIRAGDFIFVSGCGPIDATTGAASAARRVAEQTRGRARQRRRDPRRRRRRARGRRQGDGAPRRRDDLPGVQRGLREPHARAAARSARRSAAGCARCPGCGSRST